MKVNANSIFDASEKWRTRMAFDVRVKSGEYKRKMDWQMRKVLLVLALISLNSISN